MLTALHNCSYDLHSKLLQRLETETGNPTYLELANSLRYLLSARSILFSGKGIPESCESISDNEALLFSPVFHFPLLWEKMIRAFTLLKNQSPKDTYFINYIQSWLEYLLENEYYNDFDNFVESYN